jgi:hypothetical protein
LKSILGLNIYYLDYDFKISPPPVSQLSKKHGEPRRLTTLTFKSQTVFMSKRMKWAGNVSHMGQMGSSDKEIETIKNTK